MSTFVMLTQIAPGSIAAPHSLEVLERHVAERVRAACPGVTWLQSYALLGPFDYLDVFEAPDVDTAMKVAVLVRTFGFARTEVMAATEWLHFKELIRDLPGQTT
jgi:uncharacterized protein with GYD domain